MTGPMPAAGGQDAPAISAARQAYYDRISKHDMAPLWEVLKGLVPKEPNTPCAPAIWHFADAKKLVMEAGDIISAKEAERRVLVLENPALRGRSRITQSLYAGLQLISCSMARAPIPRSRANAR
jgi:gentisate 1,2-dioxygenase